MIETLTVDEAEQKAPEGPPTPAEGAEPDPGTVDEREAPAAPEEPAEAIEPPQGAVVLHGPAGSLTLRPNQKALDPEQHAALAAIGVDTASDPGVIPHLRAFVHMCQIKGLDPWAREAYLIGRGSGRDRKYTMQTGIDGYRKMAQTTGRFIRVKRTLWTGRDDDDRSFRPVEEDGDFIMKRVWYDQWPADRGEPGAAKVVIEHYDDAGSVVTTSAVADWGMYAPYSDKWEGPKGNRSKVVVDGKPVQELNAMWTKGGPHMLAKCAEALAHRRAFPGAMNGMYVAEEMHRLDAQESERKRDAQARARREAFEASRQEVQPAGTVEPGDTVDAEVVEVVEVVEDQPTPVSETVPEVVEEAKGAAEDAQRLLLTELSWQADVLGQKPATLAKRWVVKLRKNVEEFTADELLPIVNGFRSMVATAAQGKDLPGADAYATHAIDGAGPLDLNAIFEAAVEGEPEESDPDDPHPYIDSDGVCWKCGVADEIGPHFKDEEQGK